MRRRYLVPLIIVPIACIAAARAQRMELSDLPRVAIQKSQITLPGSHPFHLKAKVFQSTDLNNDNYNAEIEEYWLAPDKWRRTVKTADFSQMLIVNGDRVSEQLTGDYYPNWLRTMVGGIFDPAASVHGLDMSKSSDNPIIGGAELCRRFAFRAGIPPVQNSVFSTYCFVGDLLESVGKPGYDVSYAHYEKFSGKYVARTLNEYIGSGTEVGAKIVELTELNAPDPSLFTIDQPGTQLRTVVVREETLRAAALNAPAMEWPPIQGGKASGVLSLYVCIDRDGRVREALHLNSDHPEMIDAAAKQLEQWRFKPMSLDGNAVQVESILTFAYETKVVSKAQDGNSH